MLTLALFLLCASAWASTVHYVPARPTVILVHDEAVYNTTVTPANLASMTRVPTRVELLDRRAQRIELVRRMDMSCRLYAVMYPCDDGEKMFHEICVKRWHDWVTCELTMDEYSAWATHHSYFIHGEDVFDEGTPYQVERDCAPSRLSFQTAKPHSCLPGTGAASRCRGKLNASIGICPRRRSCPTGRRLSCERGGSGGSSNGVYALASFSGRR